MTELGACWVAYITSTHMSHTTSTSGDLEMNKIYTSIQKRLKTIFIVLFSPSFLCVAFLHRKFDPIPNDN